MKSAKPSAGNTCTEVDLHLHFGSAEYGAALALSDGLQDGDPPGEPAMDPLSTHRQSDDLWTDIADVESLNS